MQKNRQKIHYLSKLAWTRLLQKTKGVFILDGGANLSLDFPGPCFVLAGGEEVKQWSTLERLLGFLADQSVERNTPLVVIGGGATMDLGALAASLYRRGMPLILCPSTLLGAVDAAIGGKTAVDYVSKEKIWKNFAGTFYPAQEVWIAPHLLCSLPLRERKSGAGELWKMLWIRGKSGMDASVARFVKTGKLNASFLRALRFCVQEKAKIVKKDPLDKRRIREVLNFGHTAGHAFEVAAGALSHGEAVLWGMAAESFIAKAPEMERVVRRVIQDLELRFPDTIKSLSVSDWEKILLGDKKMQANKLEWTALLAPGKIVKKKSSVNAFAEGIKAFLEAYPNIKSHLLK